MSSFTTPLVIEPTGKRRDGRAIYRLTQPFTYEVGFKGSGVDITVPVGFETDLASIPWWADDWFGLNPSDGLAKKAAVIHDWLYAHPFVIKVFRDDLPKLGFGKLLYSNARKIADYIFLEAMGVPPRTGLARLWQNIKRFILFLAVRLRGRRGFNRHRASQGATS